MTLKAFFAAGAIAIASLLTLAAPAVAQDTGPRTFDVSAKPLEGTWSIETRDDGSYIVFGDDFVTSNAPDLKIFLSQQDVRNVTDNTALDEAVFVAELKSSKGAQEYKLPDGFSLTNYHSVLIHCEQFTVFWGGANL